MCVTMLVGITVVAAQLARENDSKDNTYDEKATYPVADAGALKTALAEAADGVTIADATTIRAKDDAELTFTNCEFNVTPEKKNNNSRAAAIIGNHQYSNVNLTLQGCTFNYQPCGGADSKRHEPKSPCLLFCLSYRMPATKQAGSFFSCSRLHRSISSTLTQAVTTPSPQRSTVMLSRNSSGQAVRT